MLNYTHLPSFYYPQPIHGFQSIPVVPLALFYTYYPCAVDYNAFVPPAPMLSTLTPASLQNPINLQFQHFLDGLQAKRGSVPGAELGKLISSQDYHTIFDYFSVTRSSEASAKFTPDNIIKIKAKLSCLSFLKPGASLRLSKQETGLPRTLTLLRVDNGDYQLILETKSKLASNKKRSLSHCGGSYKSGKAAWRIDSGEIEYFNLTAQLKKEKNLITLRKEVAVSKKLSSEVINQLEMGPVFISEKDKSKQIAKLSVYSVKSNHSLYSLMEDKIFASLSKEEKDHLILDLLIAVKRCHEENYVHQDIKPENILVYLDENRKWRLKLNDFGLTANMDDLKAVLMTTPAKKVMTTPQYQSPEVAYCYADQNSEFHQAYHSVDAKQSLAHHYFVEDYVKTASPLTLNQASSPAKANDLWAVGVTVYELYYGKRPSYTSVDMKNIDDILLLKKLLHRDPHQRFTIQEALECHQATMLSEVHINSPKNSSNGILTQFKQLKRHRYLARSQEDIITNMKLLSLKSSSLR